MPETPKDSNEQEPQILSFEEFSERGDKPRYNNFFAYFAGGIAGGIYRENAHYKRFSEEHPDLAESLCDKIQNKRARRLGTSETLEPFDRELYEAYKIMRGYGVSDSDLFK